jgi:hypothetical protein
MAEAYQIFEAWVKKVKNQIDKGEEVTVTVIDADTFEKITVRGKIGESKEKLPGAIPLKVISDLGEKRGNMFIKVIEEMDELSSKAAET